VLRYVARARAAVKEGTTIDMSAPRFQKVDRSEEDHVATRAAARAVLGSSAVPGSDGVLADPYGKNTGTSLAGLPKSITIPGVGKVAASGFKPAQDVAARYAKSAGIDYKPPTKYAKVDPERAKNIAAAYDAMKHDPQDPQVKAAYAAMIKETIAQYHEIMKTGLKPEFISGADPYASNPRLAILDAVKNNHMLVYPTEAGFGSDAKFDPSSNPLLAKTGIKISGKEATANDIFRIVHDYFGHVKEGVGFRADGEENAWRSHSAMYSDLARKAMTSETRGQNSWVNYGPHGEKNRSANSDNTTFADQKTGLMPDWVSREGASDEAAFKKGGEDDHQPDYLPLPKTKSPEFSVRKPKADSVSAVGVHYSSVDGLKELDPTQAGTGSTGGEARRYGVGRTGQANPRLYFYAQTGDKLPTREKAVSGNVPYRVKLNNLYDVEHDPQGFRKASGANGDLMREEIHDAGYDGLVTPPVPGIDHPAIEYFGHKDKVPVERVADPAFKKRDLNEEIPGLKAVQKHLLPEERERLRVSTGQKLVDLFNQRKTLATDMAHAALAGQAKRGWYENTSHALVHVFGPDAPRFSSLLAAMSPQSSVESNLKNALNTWKNWVAAGRPTDAQEIGRIMGRSVEGTGGEKSVLGAWRNNSVRALTSEDPANVTLSGPKVDSFMRNLNGHADAVTNDAWMASFGAVDQKLFRGALSKSGDVSNKSPGYLAMSAHTRAAAKMLTKMTGDKWTPAEVQETVWSWAKTLSELGEAKGETRSLQQLLKDGAVTDALINSTPDFRTLLHADTYKRILDQAGYGDKLTSLAADHGATGKAANAGAEGKAGQVAPNPRILQRAAGRLEEARRQRAADDVAKQNAADPDSFDNAPSESGVDEHGDVAFKKDDNKEFYSALNRSIETAKGMPKAGGEQLKQWLDGAQRRGEFKGHERQWLGVDQWLDANPKATRQELQDFVKANQVEVTPVKLGETAVSNDEKMAAKKDADESFARHINYSGNDEAKAAELKAAARAAEDRYAKMIKGNDAPKFQQYVLPGGENYREHLLTLPNTKLEKAAAAVSEFERQFKGKDGRSLPVPPDKMAEWDKLRNDVRLAKNETGGWTTGHFDELNVLMHVRMNDRKTSDGKSALHIEELQSDHHQAGRKQGYSGVEKPFDAAASKAIIDAANERADHFGNPHVTSTEDALKQYGVTTAEGALKAIGKNLDDYMPNTRGVANAPMKNTEDWAMLGFKHALREAVETGKDKVTWTTGSQQEERYWGHEAVAPAVSRWKEITKPDSVGKLGEDVFGRKMTTAMPLQVVDGGVLAALKHDQVRKAIIARLPVDVVDDLAARKLTPDDLFSKPNVVVSSLAGDSLRPVADGLVRAARSVGTDLRAKLGGLAPGGRDVELLPTLRASDLSPREVAGLLDPERLFHSEAGAAPEKGAATGSGAKPLSGESRSVGGGKQGSAELAGFLNAHAEIVHGREGLVKQAVEPPPGDGMRGFYDKILPKAVDKYVKQWGGKVGESKIDTGADKKPGWDSVDTSSTPRQGDVTVHSVDITDAMRKSVAEGQPLFKKSDADKAADDLKAMAKGDQATARGDMRGAFARGQRRIGTADAAMQQFRKELDRRVREFGGDYAKLYSGIAALERGEKINDPVIQAFWDGTRPILRANLDRANELGAEIGEVANYLSHLWKDQGRAASEDVKKVQDEQPVMNGRRPLSGNKYFTKTRVFGDMMEGIQAGRIPISKNPVDMFMAHNVQMNKLIAALEIKKALGDRGHIADLENDRVPQGYARVNDGVFAGKVLPELIARDLNNHLDPGLSKFSGWRKFRYVQNMMLSARLGLSAFHAGMTTLDSMATHVDVGLRRVARGDLPGALHDLFQAATAIPTTIRELAGHGPGSKLVRQFLGQEPMDANAAALLNMVAEGGGRARIDSTDYNNSLSTFRRALTQGNIKTAVVHAIPAAVESTTHLIAHNLVPAQKMTARVTLLKFALDGLADKLGKQKGDYAGIADAMHPDALRQIAGKINDDVDDRLGQFTYENTFMNKTVKDILHASTQSLGWNYGSLRLLLGGPKDLGNILHPEQIRGPLDKAGNIKDAKLSRVTGRLSYLLTMNAVVMTMGAMTQQALTGQGPQELKDYFYPRTGRKNADDSDERLTYPSYARDEFAFSHHPLQTAQHKLHPIWSMMAEMAENKDFFGTQIYDPNASIPKEAQQFLEYLGKSFMPYAVTGAQQNAKAGQSLAMSALPFIGITPAPGDVTKSQLQNFIAQHYYATLPQGARTQEQAESSAQFNQALAAKRRGEKPDTTGMTPAQLQRLQKLSGTTVPADRFKRLPLAAKLQAYEMATPAERRQYKLRETILGSGWQHAIQNEKDPETKKNLQEQMRQVQSG
jgi:hypothetical protein